MKEILRNLTAPRGVAMIGTVARQLADDRYELRAGSGGLLSVRANPGSWYPNNTVVIVRDGWIVGTTDARRKKIQRVEV